MQGSIEQQLVGEERYVTTLITAAKKCGVVARKDNRFVNIKDLAVVYFFKPYHISGPCKLYL